MTRIVHVAVFDTWADWEVGHAIAHLNKAQWQREPGTVAVRTVGLSRDPVRTMGGLRVLPDLALDEISPSDSAMLMLPGGDLWDQDVLAPFGAAARRWVEHGVPVAAICGATYRLALEGLLDDRPHTSNAAEFLAMSGYGGTEHYVHDRVAVDDGDVITGSGIRPVEFAVAVFARLGIYEPAILEAWTTLFRDNNPSGFYALRSAATASAAAG